MIPGITASTRRESGINVPSWAPLVLAAQDGESDGRAGVVISGPCIVRYTYSDGTQDVMMYETGSFQFTASRVEIWPENSEINSLTINYEYPPADIEDWGDFPFEELYIGRWGGKVPDWLPDSVWHIGGLHCTDPNISNWDTSNVTSLRYAFKGGFINPADISQWDVSNVVDMVEMCYYNTGFNQDLSKWCVPSITSEPEGFSEGTQSWTLPKPVWGTCPQEGGGGMDVIFPDENGVYYAERSIVQGDAITDASFYEWLNMTTPDGDLVPITQEQANAIKPDLPYTPSPVTFADPKTVTKAVGLSGASETSCIGGVGGLATTSSGGAGPELITEKCRIDIYREGKALYIPELDISICIFNRGDRLAAFIVDPVPLPSRKAYDDMARRITVQFQRPSGAFVTLNRTVEYGGFSLRSNNSTIRSEYLTGTVFKITVS